MTEIGMPRRYNQNQFTDPSFGHVVARVVCAQCGSREIAHGREFASGVRYLMVPEPEGGRTRGMLVARKVRTGIEIPNLFIAYTLEEVPTDVSTHLRCTKHGPRVVAGNVILDAIRDGRPMRPRIISA